MYIYINTIHKIQKIQNSEKKPIKFKNKKNIESRKFTVENPKKNPENSEKPEKVESRKF